MDGQTTEDQHLTVGTGVTAVFWNANRARAERAYVYAEAPFYVSCMDHAADHDHPEPGLLLWTRGDEVLVSDVRTTDCTEVGKKKILGMELQGWRRMDDRRKSPRIRNNGSMALFPYHFDDEITALDPIYGRIVDLSMSGALVVIPGDLPLGQVVEFRTILTPGHPVSVLSVVTRHDEPTGGVGIAFLDFLGTGEGDLLSYLTSVA